MLFTFNSSLSWKQESCIHSPLHTTWLIRKQGSYWHRNVMLQAVWAVCVLICRKNINKKKKKILKQSKQGRNRIEYLWENGLGCAGSEAVFFGKELKVNQYICNESLSACIVVQQGPTGYRYWKVSVYANVIRWKLHYCGRSIQRDAW